MICSYHLLTCATINHVFFLSWKWFHLVSGRFNMFIWYIIKCIWRFNWIGKIKWYCLCWSKGFGHMSIKKTINSRRLKHSYSNYVYHDQTLFQFYWRVWLLPPWQIEAIRKLLNDEFLKLQSTRFSIQFLSNVCI